MKYWISLLCLLIVISSNYGQHAFTYPGYEEEIDLQKQMDELGIPGLSIAVIKNNKIQFIEQWGFTDLEKQKAVNEQTLFQAGSLSGGLTAILTLQAVEEGKLDLDTDVNTYLKSWKLPVNKYTKEKPVTVRDLLTKNRGFTQNQKPKGYTQDAEIPSLIEILEGGEKANTKAIKVRNGKEGQENYSFETEVIQQQILEDIYGQAFRTLVEEKIFQACGIEHSTFNLKLNPSQYENAAKGYTQNGDPVVGGYLIFPEAASAGLWTTAKEYAIVQQQLISAYQGVEEQLLSPEMTRKALAKANTSGDKAMLYNQWGEGAVFGYGGAPLGYYCSFESDPENAWSVIILSNKHLQWRFVNELRSGLRKKYGLQ